MAKHRKPSNTKQNLQRVATVTTGGIAAIAISATTAGPALAAPDEAWAPLIQCESGGNPTAQNPISTASGLYQIIDGTWAAYGGLQYASKAKYATPEQQRIVAEAVLAGQGPGAWGVCGDSLWGATAESVEVQTAPAPVETTNQGLKIIVQDGDSLSKIGEFFNTNWEKALYENNRAVIGDNPNFIFPGQVLYVGGLLLPEAPATVSEAEVVGEFAHPAPGTQLTDGVGPRSNGTYHAGIDLAAPTGTPIYAAGAGVVDFAGLRNPGGFGAVVYMTLDDGTQLWYGHINTWMVGAGDRVVAGQQIGTIGDRGQSTGPHLHFQVGGTLPVNAEAWLNDKGIFVR